MGPRTPEGRSRSSSNRVLHALNSVRLLLPTEDVPEYQRHVDEWIESLAPATAAERQVILLVADLAWRLKRLGRIEERRAAAILDDLVEQSPEWRTRKQAHDVVVALETVARLVGSAVLPVPATALGGFLAGVRGVEEMLDALRDLLPLPLWPEAEVCALLAARRALSREADIAQEVTSTFTALGAATNALAAALRALDPDLDAAVERARLAASTTTLLADDEDRRFERHRRLLEASMARQLDLIAKVRLTATVGSGSFERPAPVELRVLRA